MPDPRTAIPRFRVHVAISEKNDEILVAPMSAWALSPYPEIDAGYAWSDLEPVTVLSFASAPDTVGKIVKAAIQICLFHYRAPEAPALLTRRQQRRDYLVEKFGKEDPRFVHPPSFSYVASTASSFLSYKEDYVHLLVEDDGDSNLRFIDCSLTDETSLHAQHWIQVSDLPAIQTHFPSQSSDHDLGQAVLRLCRSAQ